MHMVDITTHAKSSSNSNFLAAMNKVFARGGHFRMSEKRGAGTGRVQLAVKKEKPLAVRK